eukprot:gene17509-biopygen2333
MHAQCPVTPYPGQTTADAARTAERQRTWAGRRNDSGRGPDGGTTADVGLAPATESEDTGARLDAGSAVSPQLRIPGIEHSCAHASERSGVAGQWRGRDAGMARAWRGL